MSSYLSFLFFNRFQSRTQRLSVVTCVSDVGREVAVAADEPFVKADVAYRP